VTGAGFATLQKQTALTSDHFNFHIKKLVETGLVEKDSAQYRLTRRGKEYANRMDTDENEIEKQPKVSVALIVERHTDGKREFLAQQRLKQPYYGFWGRLGGKVRWGESFEEAAKRELKEETNPDGDFNLQNDLSQTRLPQKQMAVCSKIRYSLSCILLRLAANWPMSSRAG